MYQSSLAKWVWEKKLKLNGFNLFPLPYSKTVNTWLLISPGPLNPNIRAYSGSMTHQIGAVQGAANETTSHLSAPQTTRSTAGSGVTGVPSSGRPMSCCSCTHGPLSSSSGERTHCNVLSSHLENTQVAAALSNKRKKKKTRLSVTCLLCGALIIWTTQCQRCWWVEFLS